VDYNEMTGTTAIYLSEGVLEITALNKNMTLQAGNYLIIYANQTTETGSLNAEEWENLGDNYLEEKSNSAYILGVIVIIILAIFGFLFFKKRKKK
jgi:LPXTG-motif cell wall-anchored protein